MQVQHVWEHLYSHLKSIKWIQCSSEVSNLHSTCLRFHLASWLSHSWLCGYILGTLGYITAIVDWVVHHFHQGHSNLLWKLSYPIWDIPLHNSWKFYILGVLSPFSHETKTLHLFLHLVCFIFVRRDVWKRLWQEIWHDKKLAREIHIFTGQILREVHTCWRGGKVRIRLCISITHK